MGNANDTKKYVVSSQGKDHFSTDSYARAKQWLSSTDEYPDAFILEQAPNGERSAVRLCQRHHVPEPCPVCDWQPPKPRIGKQVKPRKPISIDSTEIHTWFERDRAHVGLRSKLDDKTIVEWRDSAVQEAIEDGFLPFSAFMLGRLHDESALHDAAYKYAESHGMLPDAPEHYVAMSGLRGCIPDSCEVFESHALAVEFFTDLFSLGRTRKTRLRKNNFLELTRGAGAEYCEIQECDCDNPAQHFDGGL